MIAASLFLVLRSGLSVRRLRVSKTSAIDTVVRLHISGEFMDAMILAAGFGTRLQPFSLHTPKPLFPVLGQPMLGRVIGQLRQTALNRLGVNAHYLSQQIHDYLRDYPGVYFQNETKLLGTGGALRRSLSYFDGEEPLLVTNGDIYHDVDYQLVFDAHQASGADVTMLLHDYPRFNKIQVDRAGWVISIGIAEDCEPSSKLLAFTGIHVLNKEIIRKIPDNSFSSIIDLYRQCLYKGAKILAFTLDDFFWCDIGTLADYLGLHRLLLSRMNCCDGLVSIGENKFMSNGPVNIGQHCRLEDWGFIGKNASIGDRAVIRGSVVWENAVVPDDAQVVNAIVQPETFKY